MSEIQSADSVPPYISLFLKNNLEQLINIHDEGKQEYGEGCLGFKCSEKENKMDVFFMNERLILQTIKNQEWQQLKSTIQEKRLFLINDLDINSIFLIYI